jgi:conjugal transfer mating pair stabilization protein TraG
MATVEVFTVGGGAYIVNAFNAVAAWTTAGGYLGMLQVTMVLGLIFATIIIAFDNNWRAWLNWYLTATLIYLALMVPKVDVVITDRLESTLPSANVANVPIGLGMLASFTSQIGDYLTTGAELVFGLPTDMNYSRNGMIYGSRLMEATQQLRIRDPEFASNLDEHFRMCVFYDILLGIKSMQTLANSDDLWATLGPGSPARSQKFLTRQPGGNVTSQILTCQEAYNALDSQWATMIDQLNGPFAKNLFPKQTEALAKAKLVADLPTAYNYLTGVSKSASEILRQTLAINAMGQAMHTMSGTGGGSSVDVYAATRAEIQTRRTYSSIADSAMKWVPLLNVVLTVMFYSLFPILFPLFLMPRSGIVALKGYVYGFFYLAAWGPLYVILHMILTFKSSVDGAAAAGGVGLTIANWTGIEGVQSDAALLAGYLIASVPFLAAGVAKGAMAISGQATSFLAPSQAAASEAAREAATGNISLGNSSFDTVSFNTRQGNNWSVAGAYSAGFAGMSQRQSEGSVTTQYPDASVVDSSGAVSRFPFTPQLSQELQATFSQSASSYKQRASSLSNSAQSAATSALTNLSEFRKAISQGDTLDSAYGADDRSVITTTLSTLDQATDALSNRFGLSRSVAESLATQTMFGARVTTGAGGGQGRASAISPDGDAAGPPAKGLRGAAGKLGGLLGGIGGAGASTGYNMSNNDTKSLSADNSLSQAMDYLDTVSRQQNWADQRDAFLRSSASSSRSDISSRADAVSSSLTRSQTLSEEARESFETAQRLENAATLRDSEGASLSENLSQDFLNFVLREQRQMPGLRPVWNPTRGMPQTPEQVAEKDAYMRVFISRKEEAIRSGVQDQLVDPTPAQILYPSVNRQAGVRPMSGAVPGAPEEGDTVVPLRNAEGLGAIRSQRDDVVEDVSTNPAVGGRLSQREGEAARVKPSISNNPQDTIDRSRDAIDTSDIPLWQQPGSDLKKALRKDD